MQHNTAQPTVEAFLPKSVITEESEVDLNTLQKSIDSVNVVDAIIVYKLLVNKKITVPEQLKQSLLELASFYNQNDPLPIDMFEERSAAAVKKRLRDAKAEEWTQNCFADELFNSIEPKTPEAYNTMIRALYKFNNAQRADELFDDAKKNGIKLDCGTYNAYIANIGKKETTSETRLEQTKTTLKEMDKENIKPNVHTLNAVLIAIKSGGYVRPYALSLLAEFKRLNVEPSLETYFHLLTIFHGKNSPPSLMIDAILTEIEKKEELVVQGVDDLKFFYKAMETCRYTIKNSASYARRIDNIITRANNIILIGHTKTEQLYYRLFLSTILTYEPFDEFMKLYDQLVPETYSLEPSIVEDIFSTVNIIGAIQHIPKFWTDMTTCGLTNRSEMNDTLLRLMTQNQPIADINEHQGLSEQFADIAWSIYCNLISQHHSNARRDQLVPATQLANIIVLLVRADRFENAKTIIDSCLESRKDKKIIGTLSEDALSIFINSCILNKQPKIAIQVISYSIENGVGDSAQYAKKLVESMTLDPDDIRRISGLVGRDVLKSVNQTTK